MSGYDAKHLVRRILRIVLVWTIGVAGNGSAEGVDRTRGGTEANGGATVIREETTGTMNSTGDARRDGLVDGEGTGVAMMRCASRRGVLIAVSMTSFAGIAIAMRHIVCVIVHDSTGDS